MIRHLLMLLIQWLILVIIKLEWVVVIMLCLFGSIEIGYALYCSQQRLFDIVVVFIHSLLLSISTFQIIWLNPYIIRSSLYNHSSNDLTIITHLHPHSPSIHSKNNLNNTNSLTTDLSTLHNNPDNITIKFNQWIYTSVHANTVCISYFTTQSNKPTVIDIGAD